MKKRERGEGGRKGGREREKGGGGSERSTNTQTETNLHSIKSSAQ